MRLRALLPLILSQVAYGTVFDLGVSTNADVTIDTATVAAVKVSLGSPFLTFFDSQRCTGTQKKMHVPADSNPSKTAQEWWVEGKYLAKGNFYKGAASIFGQTFSAASPLTFAIESEEDPSCAPEADARLGLALTSEAAQLPDSVYQQLLSASAEKMVIINAGAFNAMREDGSSPTDDERKASISYGEASYALCDPPSVFHAVDGNVFKGEWAIRGQVVVGTKRLAADAKISFSLEADTRFIDEAWRALGPSTKTRAEHSTNPYPSVWLLADGRSYSMNAADYINFNGDAVENAVALLQKSANQQMDFRFGQHFLQNYCLFLKYADDKQTLGFGKVKSRNHNDPAPPSEVIEIDALRQVDIKLDNVDVKSVALTLNSPFVSVFDVETRSGCTGKKIFHTPAETTPRVSGVEWNVDGAYEATGNLHAGTAELFGLAYSGTKSFVYGVETAERPQCAPTADARVGFALPEKAEHLQYSLFSQLLEGYAEKTLIIDSGLLTLRREDGSSPSKEETKGRFVFGQAAFDRCDPPTKYHPVDGDLFKGQWAIKGRIVVDKTYSEVDSKIGFDLTSDTRLKADLAQLLEPRKRDKTQRQTNPFPNLWLVADDVSYALLPQDYLNFAADDSAAHEINAAAEDNFNRLDFKLGLAFLQNFCLFLKLDPTNNKQSMGLGRVVSRRRADPSPPTPPNPPPPPPPLPPAPTPVPVPAGSASFDSSTTIGFAVKFEDDNYDFLGLSLSSTGLYVLDEDVKKDCPALNLQTHKQKYQTVKKDVSISVDGGKKVTGKVCREKVEFASKSLDGFSFLTHTAAGSKCSVSEKGAIGLARPAESENVQYSVFDQLVGGTAEKQVIIHRGLSYKKNKDGNYPAKDKDTYTGHISWGEASIPECLAPPAYHDVSKQNGQWILEGTLRIGTVETSAKVAFDLSGVVQLEDKIVRRYFNGSRSGAQLKGWPWPTVRVKADGQAYFMDADDFVDHSANAQTPAVSALSVSNSLPVQAVLGQRFLQNYCLFLKKTDDGKQLLGLGQAKGRERALPADDPPTVDSAHRPALAGLFLLAVACSPSLLFN